MAEREPLTFKTAAEYLRTAAPHYAGSRLAECAALLERACTYTVPDSVWIPVTEKLPDDDLTVMIACKDADEPVWLGWHDESGWYSVDATPMRNCVTHWKPMPEGPNG